MREKHYWQLFRAPPYGLGMTHAEIETLTLRRPLAACRAPVREEGAAHKSYNHRYSIAQGRTLAANGGTVAATRGHVAAAALRFSALLRMIDLGLSAMENQGAFVVDHERCSRRRRRRAGYAGPWVRRRRPPRGHRGWAAWSANLTRLHRRKCARLEWAALEGIDTQGGRRDRLRYALLARQIVRRSRAVSGVAAGWAGPAGRTMASVR